MGEAPEVGFMSCVTMRSASVAVLMFGAGFGCVEKRKPAATPVQSTWEQPVSTPIAESPEPAGGVREGILAPANVRGGEGETSHDGLSPPPSLSPSDSSVGEAEGERGRVGEGEHDPIAVVNGEVIDRSRFVDLLIETQGLRLLEEMILLKTAERRSAEMGIRVGDADMAAAHEDALRRLWAPVGGEDAPFDRDRAEQLLAEFLEAKNLSRREWDVRMTQRAYVKKIAEAEVAQMKVTEDMLRQEHARTYGEKIQIRHIQLSSQAAVHRARALLKEKDFELVARQASENQVTAGNGGLLPPFTRNDEAVTPLIRETAFALAAEEVSEPVYENGWYHILRVERRFPPSGVAFENADHAALRTSLLDRLARQEQERLEAELFQSAAVDVREPALGRQFDAKYRQGKP